MPRDVKLLGLSAIILVAIAATYAGGSAYMKSRERHAVEKLLLKNGGNLRFGRFAAFGHEYCQEVFIGRARKTMRLGPRAWDSGPLVIRGANSSFEECRREARG